jgi:predicted nucleotidyltransferase
MNPLLNERKRELAELCRRCGVEQLDVFGSASRLDFGAGSDFDFVARFADTGPGYADRYMELAESLEKLFGRPVGLLTERSLRNPILVTSLARDRKTLYAA